jgi:hypothetical protein
VNDDPREFVFTRYEARYGVAWLVQAYALFRRSRLRWVALLLAYYILLLLLRAVPYIGPYAMTILKPVFAVGLLAAAWTQERGGTPALGQLFQGFRANLSSLLPIGIFFVVGITAAVFASALVDGGKLLDLMSNAGAMSEQEIATALGDSTLEGGMLFSALLSIPVLIAAWWAPALVVFQNAGAGTALLVSLRAALANWRPLAVYGLAVFFYGAALPALVTGALTLILPDAIAPSIVVALLVPYALFFAATLHISDYVSYRDVFHAGETLAPLPGPHVGL